jgi:hypothetical protein
MSPMSADTPPPDAALDTAVQTAGRMARGLGVRALARQARKVQLSGNALVGVSVSLTVLTAAILLWAGLATGGARVGLLLMAAVLLRLRLLSVRLGAMTPADGMAAPAPRALTRWMSPIESLVLLLAAGMNAFGAHLDIGPVVGVVAGAALIVACLRRRAGHAIHEPSRPHSSTLLALICLAAMLEPLWGWRGQTFVIGLCVIAAVLAVQAVRRPGATAAG